MQEREKNALDQAIEAQFVQVSPTRSQPHPSRDSFPPVVYGTRALPSALHLHSEAEAIDERVNHFIRRKQSVLSRLFPTALDKLRDKTALRLAQTEDDFYIHTLQIATQARLQEIAEKFDGWLRTLKVESRQRFIDFVLLRIEALRTVVDARRNGLIEHLRRRRAQLHAMSDMPEYTERLHASIDAEFDRSLLFLDDQLARFEQLANEELIRLPRQFDSGS